LRDLAKILDDLPGVERPLELSNELLEVGLDDTVLVPEFAIQIVQHIGFSRRLAHEVQRAPITHPKKV